MSNAEQLDPYAPCRCGSGKKYKFCCMKKDREEGRPEGAAPAPGAPQAGAPRIEPGRPGGPTSSGPRPGTTWRPPSPRTPGRNG